MWKASSYHGVIMRFSNSRQDGTRTPIISRANASRKDADMHDMLFRKAEKGQFCKSWIDCCEFVYVIFTLISQVLNTQTQMFFKFIVAPSSSYPIVDSLQLRCTSRWHLNVISHGCVAPCLVMVICSGLGSSAWCIYLYSSSMMTSSNGNIFRVTGPLCREFTGLWWIPRTRASDTELWCILWSVPEPTVEQTMETPVIWDAILLIMTSL